jgi:hypothetical protein
MGRTKAEEDRPLQASFRMTLEERRTLNKLAGALRMSYADTIRFAIARTADLYEDD